MMKVNKNIVKNNSDIVKGLILALEPVVKTFGPNGKSVLIEQDSYSSKKLTQDGAKVLKSLVSSSQNQYLLDIVSDAANSIAEHIGDGTTTLTILIISLLDQIKEFVGSERILDIMSGVLSLKEEVEKIINDCKENISIESDYDKVLQIASISSKSTELGVLVADAYRTVGTSGLVQVSKSNINKTELKKTSGYFFEKGYMSNYFVTDKDKSTAIIKDCYVLVCKTSINTLTTKLIEVLTEIAQLGKPLFVIAEDIAENVLLTLISNHLQGKIKILAVKSPAFGNQKTRSLEDIAVLTGATIIDDGIELLKDIKMSHLGQAGLIKSNSNETVISDGKGSEEAINQHKKNKQRLIESMESSGFDKDMMSQEMAKLNSGICTILVSGISEPNQNERYDLLEDAVRATDSALKQGVVSGGGSCFIKLAVLLQKKQNEKKQWGNIDKELGVQFLINSFINVVSVLLSNNRKNNDISSSPEVILKDLLDCYRKDSGLKLDRGYNAKEGVFVDSLKKAGIIDSAGVLQKAIPLAIDTVNSIVSISYILLNKEKKENLGF